MMHNIDLEDIVSRWIVVTHQVIGVNGRRIKGPMPKLKSGVTQLNFVLKKNRRGSYDAFLAEAD
jgi:hypothetical protein